MLRRYVALGDCEIAGKSGFAGQEVIVMGIDTVGAEIVADVEEPGGGIEEQRKIHLVGEGGRAVREALQAIEAAGPGPDVRIEDAEGRPAFFARTVRGVRNGSSPEWMAKELKAIGQKPISTLVDITNYIMIDQIGRAHV